MSAPPSSNHWGLRMPRGRPKNNDAGSTKRADGSGANLGFEAKLWAAADALRNNMDAAEYKHVVLGLIFLKYISDAFEAKHDELAAQKAQGADPEDPDEYRAVNIFWGVTGSALGLPEVDGAAADHRPAHR